MEFKNIKEISDTIQEVSLSNHDLALNQLNRIIDSLPPEVSNLIISGFDFNRIPKEYMLTSILFAFSNAIGLSYELDALGHRNYANLYFAVVGNRGDMKSLPMKIATRLLSQFDSDSYNEGSTSEFENIKKKKLLIQNATIQAAQSSHYYNKYSIGIFMDEIMFLIEKMANKSSSDGMAWKTFLLEGYNNSIVDILRKTTESYRIDKSYPTVLGSIQDHFIPSLFANGNLESGLIDRMFFSVKLTSNNVLKKDPIPPRIIENYEKSLKKIYSIRKYIEEDEEQESIILNLDKTSENLLLIYLQNIINKQINSEDLLKGYMSKLQISIFKLIIIVHAISCTNNETKIDSKTVELAIEINEFYFTNFKIINSKNQSKDTKPLDIDKVIESAINNGAAQKDVVAITGISKPTISRKWNSILNNMKLETKV